MPTSSAFYEDLEPQHGGGVVETDDMKIPAGVPSVGDAISLLWQDVVHLHARQRKNILVQDLLEFYDLTWCGAEWHLSLEFDCDIL